MKQNNKKQEIIPFKQYWENLPKSERKVILENTKDVISNSNLYNSIRENKFSRMMQFYLEQKLNMQFDWTNETI